MNELNKAFKAIAKGNNFAIELNGEIIIRDVEYSQAMEMLKTLSDVSKLKGELPTFDQLQMQYSSSYNNVTLSRTFFDGLKVSNRIELICKIEH